MSSRFNSISCIVLCKSLRVSTCAPINLLLSVKKNCFFRRQIARKIKSIGREMKYGAILNNSRRGRINFLNIRVCSRGI